MVKNEFEQIVEIFGTFSAENQNNILIAFLQTEGLSFSKWFLIENSKNWVSFPGSGLIYIE